MSRHKSSTISIQFMYLGFVFADPPAFQQEKSLCVMSCTVHSSAMTLSNPLSASPMNCCAHSKLLTWKVDKIKIVFPQETLVLRFSSSRSRSLACLVSLAPSGQSYTQYHNPSYSSQPDHSNTQKYYLVCLSDQLAV